MIEQMLDLIVLPLGNGIVGQVAQPVGQLEAPFLRHLVEQDRRHHLADRAVWNSVSGVSGSWRRRWQTEVEDGASRLARSAQASARAVEAAVSLRECGDCIQRAGSFGGGCCAAAGGHRAGDGDTDRSGAAAPVMCMNKLPLRFQVLESGRGRVSARRQALQLCLPCSGVVRLIDDPEPCRSGNSHSP